MSANRRGCTTPKLALYRLAFCAARAAWIARERGGLVAPEPGSMARPAPDVKRSATSPAWESEPVLDSPLGSGGA